MQGFITVKFIRHNPGFPFCFDEVTYEAVAESLAEAQALHQQFETSCDQLMPQTSQTPENPLASTPPAIPMQTPVPTPQAPQMTGQAPWLAAEMTLSPCGPSEGKMLGSCDDKDLDYLANKYKKDATVREHAALILAARRANLTVKK